MEIILTLTVADVNNALALFSLAPIKGAEAEAVADLTRKFRAALPQTPVIEAEPEGEVAATEK